MLQSHININITCWALWAHPHPFSASKTGVMSIVQYVFDCLAGLSRSILASRKWPFPWLLTPWRRRIWETIPVMWKMVTAVAKLPSSSSGAVRALWRLPLQQVFAFYFRLSGFEVEKKKNIFFTIRHYHIYSVSAVSSSSLKLYDEWNI